MLTFTGRPARLHYTISGYRVLSPGDFVLCAITGERIPLDRLRYWSAALQEPYVSAEVATARHDAMRAGAK